MLTFFKTKLSFTILAVLFTACLAFLASCGDGSTDPGVTDIDGYTLSYSSVTVPRTTAYPFEIIPRWDVTPSQVTYSISPSLPDGVSLNPTTGRVTGNALNITRSTIAYTITATGSGTYTGSVTATFTIHALIPLGININSLSLNYDDINVYVNQSIDSSPIWINSDYPVTANYEVNPPLPLGLSFNTNTGEISGALTSPMSTSNYTITATGIGVYAGSNVITFNLTVAKAGKTFLDTLTLSYNNIGVSYSNAKEVYTFNINNTSNSTTPTLTPQWSATPTATYAVEPPLPPWLSFNPNTGVITNVGTPTPYYRRHTITASADGGSGYTGTASAKVIIAIAVNADNNNIQSLVDTQISDQGDKANLNIIDTSQVTDMNSLFQNKDSFNGDISGWDVGNVGNVEFMFNYARSFNGDISDWDVGNVTNMKSIFYSANSFNGDISEWNVSKVTTMKDIFTSANFFNGDISKWNVSNVTSMWSMFSDAHAFNGDISEWNVSRVTDMHSMFFNAHAFNGDISEWNVSRVTDMWRMFYKAYAFNGDISKWNISRVTDMLGMFYKTTSFTRDLES